MPPTAAASTCRVPPPSGFVAHLAARVRHCSARCGHLCSMAGRSIRYQDVRPCWFLWPQGGTSWLKRLNDLSAPRLTFRDPQQMFSLRNGRTTGASPRARGRVSDSDIAILLAERLRPPRRLSYLQL